MIVGENKFYQRVRRQLFNLRKKDGKHDLPQHRQLQCEHRSASGGNGQQSLRESRDKIVLMAHVDLL